MDAGPQLIQPIPIMRPITHALLILLLPTWLTAHCQIPCGIYGDEQRFVTMLEHAETVRKSTAEINRIAGGEEKNYNQLVRWVNNKELHAQMIQDICYDYFLAQRIKSSMDDYTEQLKAVHAIIVAAMKTKQTVDPDNVAALEDAISKYKTIYLGAHEHGHKH